MDTPPTSIGPGLWRFIAFFVLAVALWLLMRNMNTRMRRMAYRSSSGAPRRRGPGDGRGRAAEADGAWPERPRREADGPAPGPASPDDGPAARAPRPASGSDASLGRSGRR